MNEQLTTPELLERIRQIWESARQQATRSVNSAHVCANWLIGKQIVEAEQGGEIRADYGKALLASLSDKLSQEYGSGFSVSGLRYMRLFFNSYPGLFGKHHAVRDELVATNIGAINEWRPGLLHPGLSWTHYRTLLKVDRQAARDFYEIEAIRNGWSARQLERQIASLLFDRLAKSTDKAGLLKLASEGMQALSPVDVSCGEKNDAVVRYVLGENNQQIFASRYQLYLPTEAQLQAELQREWRQLAPPKE